MASSKKKTQIDNFNSLGARKDGKNSKKGSKKLNFFCFKQISKCDTCFYMHFSRSFQNIVFNLYLQSQKNLGYIIFFSQTGFFSVLYKLKEKYFLKKNPLNYYTLKVTKFHGDSVKNESARTKQIQGGANVPPPLHLFRVNRKVFSIYMCICSCIKYISMHIC